MEPGLRGGTSFDCFTPQAIHLSCKAPDRTFLTLNQIMTYNQSSSPLLYYTSLLPTTYSTLLGPRARVYASFDA